MWVDKFKIDSNLIFLDNIRLNEEINLTNYLKDNKTSKDLKILIFLQSFSTDEFGESIGYETYIEYKNDNIVIPRAIIKKRYKYILASNSLFFNNHKIDFEYASSSSSLRAFSDKNKIKLYTYKLEGDVIENITFKCSFLAGTSGNTSKPNNTINYNSSASISLNIGNDTFYMNIPQETLSPYWDSDGVSYYFNYILSNIPEMHVTNISSNNVVIKINTGEAYFKDDYGRWSDTDNAYIMDLCVYDFSYTCIKNKLMDGEVCLLIGI